MCAEKVGRATVTLPEKPTLRRFTWCRIHHELLRKPLWRLVARMSGAPLPFVKLFVVELDLYASENVPRGSVDGFNVAALAADWGLADDGQLARIYAALEDPDVGWIDQDFIVTFWARNPDQELTERERELARARQRRARDRKKAVKESRALATYPPSRVTQRDSVMSRSRSDQIIKQAVAEKEQSDLIEALIPTTDLHSHSGSSGDDSGDTEIWLALEGKRIVAERCRVLPSRAWLDIARWRKELLDDVAALATIIHDADLMGLERGKFTDRVREAITRYRYDPDQRRLPLPTIVKKTGEAS
jgi:hypothetical protein